MKIFLEQVRYAALYVYDFFFATSFGNNSSFLDHFWSLSVEEQFYIFWPLLILLIPEKALKKLFLSFIVLGPLFRLILLFIYRSGEFDFLARSVAWFIYPLPLQPHRRLCLWRVISQYPFPNAKKQFFILLGIVPIIGYATQYIATGGIGEISAFGFPMFLGDAYKYIWGYSLLNYFFAVAICAVVKERVFLRFLDWKPMRYLGKISYGLYVYHYPIIWFVGRIPRPRIAGNDCPGADGSDRFPHNAFGRCRQLSSDGKASDRSKGSFLFA